MNKEIAIIGVNGKMGKWFANYFHKMGFKVKGFDTNNEIKEKFIIKEIRSWVLYYKWIMFFYARLQKIPLKSLD